MIIHRVKTGQTPESIAEEYGIPVQSLLSENGLTSDEPLVTGQELVILVPEVTYTVKTGDSLYSVADEYGTTVNRLLADNPSLRGNPLIYPGQTLVIKYSGEKNRDIIVNGYAYPFIDEAVLRSVLPYLTYLTVFTYGFREDGSLIPADDAEITGIARSYGVKTLLLISTLCSPHASFPTPRHRKGLSELCLRQSDPAVTAELRLILSISRATMPTGMCCFLRGSQMPFTQEDISSSPHLLRRRPPTSRDFCMRDTTTVRSETSPIT